MSQPTNFAPRAASLQYPDPQPVIALDPPHRSQSYILLPDSEILGRAGKYVRAGAKLVNASPSQFRARSLLLGAAQTAPDLETRYVSAAAAGAMTFQFEGRTTGGVEARTFQVNRGGTIRLDVTAYETFSVVVLSSTIAGAQAFALACNTSTKPDEHAWVAVQHLDTGTYVVPPGADVMYAGTADATFAWATPLDATRNVTVTQAIVAGQAVPVAGLYYRPTTAPFEAVFRVRL